MATGTNGIATISDCNGVVGGAFSTTTFSSSGSLTGTCNIGSYYESYMANGFPTAGDQKVNGSSTYVKITLTSSALFRVTVTNSVLKASSSTGADIYSYRVSSGSAMMMFGAFTSTTTSSPTHGVTFYPNFKNENGGVSVAEILVPPGTWYMRLIAVNNMYALTDLKTSSTGSALTSGSIYIGWTFNYSVSSVNYCPTYSEINGTGKFSISGSYTTNQCVQYSHIKKKQGIINLTIGNSTSNSMGFYYTGNNRFSGSTYTQLDTFISTKAYMSTYGTANFVSSSGSTGKWSVSMDPSWSAGYYYLINYASSGYYGVSEVYLNSSQATTLNNGTNLTLTANYWTVNQY